VKRAQIFSLMTLLPLAAVLPAAELSDAHSALMPKIEDYTLLWWADGPSYISNTELPPTSQMLCLQSGSWGLVIDTKNVRVVRAGRWAAPMGLEDGMQPGRTAMEELPAAPWDCAVVVGGRRFTCVGHIGFTNKFLQPVRFVESGRFFQRVVIAGLRFEDSEGMPFLCNASLEISAWPDRLALRLDLAPSEPPSGGVVELRFGDRRVSAALSANTSARLQAFGDSSASRASLEVDPALKVEFDEALGCQMIQLPEESRNNQKGTLSPEDHLDRLDRWSVTLRNDSDRPTVARLMFIQNKGLNLTGFTPMLCEVDGTPTGLPVQISKNWHREPKKGTLPHQGPWFHGCAFVRLPPNSKRELVFQMVNARYGGIFAASLAQLSLIGWGHNQFWDQTAIGSFGESICFEPGRVQRRCFIDDVRPLMTSSPSRSQKTWGWADNCGGGDFLMWQDAQGVYQPMRATRTEYRAYGPCLTHARYTEDSVGGELTARMDVSVPRSQDYLRTFFHLRYDVRRKIQWSRLAFFQLGADFYNETPARHVAVGDMNNLGEEWEPRRATDVFDRVAVPLTGDQPWVSIHGVDFADLRLGVAAATRGVIVRSWRAVLGGKPAPQPYASFFCTKRGENSRTVIELAPPPGIKELLPGDFVEADLELAVFPADPAAYYGPDTDFKQVLAREADTWQLVQREAAGNALKIEVGRGSVLNAYPLLVSVDESQTAEVTVQGGVGCVPMTFTGLTSPDGYALFVDGSRINQTVHGNDYWQTDYDASTQRWRQTFNVALPANQPAAVRFEPVKQGKPNGVATK